jgi:ABC-2 type transport system permease protein
MLFNMMLTVPFAVFGSITLSISMKAGLVSTVLSVVLVVLLCAFSTTWGCVCGIRHMRLDWENEVEVIKQGAAVAMYLFPNMFGTMILLAATVMLGTRMNHTLILGALIVVIGVLAGLCYKKVMKLCE